MRRTLSLSILGFLLVPLMASAHGDGLSFESKVGNILVDIGYGQVLPTTGSTVTYSFDLFDVTKPDVPVFEPFTEVSVRLFDKDRKEALNRTLANDGTNIPSLSYAFKDGGNYTLVAVYKRNGKADVGATFGFAVNAPVASSAASSSALSKASAASVSSVATGNAGNASGANPMIAIGVGVVVILALIAGILMRTLGGTKKHRPKKRR